jgi:uncharacterized protein (DUF427 family)
MSLARENVQHYPRPPALEPVAERLSVMLGGVEIAATTRGFRVLETHHAPTYYFPPEDVRQGALRPSAGRTLCEWKGVARYFDVVAEPREELRAAWSYPNPTPVFAPIAGFVAFYPGRMDACFVGDMQVRPQPGDFYGGWVTPNLDGIVKGGPGTEGW